jgi:5,6,7,8-tetrahydromethanopterin hydro-lyase
MAKINRVLIGESLIGDGNEVAHIDLLMGPRGSAAETAFCNALTNNKDGFTSLLAVVAPNLLTKPNTILFNKVTIKGAKQAVQMFGPAQHAVALAVADSVEDGTIPQDEADDLFLCVGVFIHWQAEDVNRAQRRLWRKRAALRIRLHRTDGARVCVAAARAPRAFVARAFAMAHAPHRGMR